MGTAVRVVDQLADQADVSIVGVAGGEVLTYDFGTGKWVNAAGGVAWGEITGTLANQTDLQTALDAKAADSEVVKLASSQTITGVKTFTTNFVVGNSGGLRATTIGPGFSGGSADGFLTMQPAAATDQQQSFYILPSGVGRLGTRAAVSIFRNDYVSEFNTLGGNARVERLLIQSRDGDYVIDVTASGTLPSPGQTRPLKFKMNGSDSLTIATDRSVSVGALLFLGVYTFSTVPSASSNTGAIIRISDRAQKQAYSDGTNWRFTGTDAIIS